jgi:hypothetical protein
MSCGARKQSMDIWSYWGSIPVGSRTGAVVLRSLLVCIQGFPLRARLGVSVTPFPAPATSHVACGFAALRAPAHFTSRVMRPMDWMRLSGPAVNKTPGTDEKSPRVPYSHSLFHRFQPKPRRCRALAKWRRIFLLPTHAGWQSALSSLAGSHTTPLESLLQRSVPESA